MPLAVSIDLIIWIIIAIVVMVAKGLGKLSTPEDEEPAAEEPPAPRPRPRPRAKPAAPPPVAPIQIHEMMERLTRPRQPIVATPPPVMPAPRPAAPPPPKPTPVAAAAAPATPNRATQWAGALRDRSNIRNIIIGAEIIGPPKSLSN